MRRDLIGLEERVRALRRVGTGPSAWNDALDAVLANLLAESTPAAPDEEGLDESVGLRDAAADVVLEYDNAAPAELRMAIEALRRALASQDKT